MLTRGVRCEPDFWGRVPSVSEIRDAVDVLIDGTIRQRPCRRSDRWRDYLVAAGSRMQLRRAGQVWSKMRFASAQLIAYVENRLWLAGLTPKASKVDGGTGGRLNMSGSRLVRVA
jgi:hypothetical protein